MPMPERFRVTITGTRSRVFLTHCHEPERDFAFLFQEMFIRGQNKPSLFERYGLKVEVEELPAPADDGPPTQGFKS